MSEIVINDCLRTKKIKISNIIRNFNNLSAKPGTNQSFLKIKLDDQKVLAKFKGQAFGYANYNNSLYSGDPTNPAYADDKAPAWQISDTRLSEKEYYDFHTKINTFHAYSDLSGLHVACLPHKGSGAGAWNGFSAKHFDKIYTDTNVVKSMYTAEAGKATFTIALPTAGVTRHSIYPPTSPWYKPNDDIDEHILDYDHIISDVQYAQDRTNFTLAQRNFITIGANSGEYNARFVLFFDNITKNPYNMMQDELYDCEPGVYLVILNASSSAEFNTKNNFEIGRRYPILNADGTHWDGNSMKSFNFSYKRDENDNIVGKLEMIENNIPILVANDIATTSLIAVNQSATEFGGYTMQHLTNFILKDFKFEINPLDNYNFSIYDEKGLNYYNTDVNGKGGEKLLSRLKNDYTFEVGENDDGLISWFLDKSRTGNNFTSVEDKNFIKLNDEWLADPYAQDYLKYFQKKIKEISVYVKSLTKFIAKNKNIFDVDCGTLANLEYLDLSDNKLTHLDLSNNTNLSYINVSNNKQLSTLILPGGNTKSDIIINISNTALESFELFNNTTTASYATLIVGDEDETNELPYLKKLIIQGINLRYDGTSLISPNINFPALEEVNISESNLLTNKVNLIKFLAKLPDRTEKSPGIIYMYGKKYTAEGIQGSTKVIAESLETLKNKNWIFYV